MVSRVSLLRRIKDFIRSHRVLNNVRRAILTLMGNSKLQARCIRKAVWKALDRKVDEEKLMVNIGGGHFFKRHWRVLDYPVGYYDWMPYAVDYHFDLTSGKRFPFRDNLVTYFFSAHTLEHIPQEHCQHIFDELFRSLKPGGAVRLSMPDFDNAYEAFKENNISFFSKYAGDSIEEKFLDFFATALRNEISGDQFRRDISRMTKEEFADNYTGLIGRHAQAENAGNHINWWNYNKAEKMLRSAGFTEVYQSREQESRFADMKGRGRYCGFDSTHPELSFFIEAVKAADIK